MLPCVAPSFACTMHPSTNAYRNHDFDNHGKWQLREYKAVSALVGLATLSSVLLSQQAFFVEDMGLPLRMTPDYNDFSCQFS